jgi:hypothetical protein
MAVPLIWPPSLKAPTAYAPGIVYSDVQSEAIGPTRDVAYRWTKRTLALEWGNMSNRDFAQLDALVDLLGQRRGVLKVPWWPYQAMLGKGSGVVSLSGAHAAGATTISTVGWTGSKSRGDLGRLPAARRLGARAAPRVKEHRAEL